MELKEAEHNAAITALLQQMELDHRAGVVAVSN
jgi:hypothetical protein